MQTSKLKYRIVFALFALAVLAPWPAAYAAPLEPRAIQIGATAPAIVPFEKNRGIGMGLGFLESIKFPVTDHLRVEFTGGIIYYPDADDRSEQDYPVMAGVSYLFGSPENMTRTYVAGHLGYTYARRGDEVKHRATSAVGFGLDIRLTGVFHLDLGGDLIVTNLQGRFQEVAGVLIKVGGTFHLF